MNDWGERLVDSGLRQLHGEQPPEQTAVILHRLRTELAAVTQLPRSRPPAPTPRLLGALLGAAAALLLVWLFTDHTAATTPTVVQIEIAALSGGVECLPPAGAPATPLLLSPGERGLWRAQVGSRLQSRGVEGAQVLLSPFGRISTQPHTVLEVSSMEFSLRNGALATGALTFAVVAGVATWHTLSRAETANAGQELRLQAATGEPSAQLALANQKLDAALQQNKALQERLQQLETQLARKRAETPVAAEVPAPAPVVAEAAGGEPVFTADQYQQLLASIDWQAVGSASAEMGPKLVALLQALAEGKEIDMADAIALQKLNGKLLDMVPKLMESGLPGFGPNGVFSHPLIAANSLASMLAAGGSSLTADQQATLQNLVRSFAAESQTVHDSPREFSLEELVQEAAMKDRFYQAMADNLTPEQRALMYPEGAGKYDGSSLFSSGLVWSTVDRGVPSLDPREFARMTSDGLGQRLGLDEQASAAVRAVIERVAQQNQALWLNPGTPLELRGGPQSFLQTGRAAAALQMQLQWMRELQNSGALTPQQLERLRSLNAVYVPVPR